jgi:hypothetical protein
MCEEWDSLAVKIHAVVPFTLPQQLIICTRRESSEMEVQTEAFWIAVKGVEAVRNEGIVVA